jgi:hypothetical protein
MTGNKSPHPSVFSPCGQEEKQMAKGEKDGIDRRGALECMIWASDFTPRNCSPDFAFWQLGSRTIWNPSEEFDVGVDVLYNKIDTAFSGRVALSQNGILSSRLYNAKNEGVLSAVFRVQRNFLP